MQSLCAWDISQIYSRICSSTSVEYNDENELDEHLNSETTQPPPPLNPPPNDVTMETNATKNDAIIGNERGILKIQIDDAAELKNYGSYCSVEVDSQILSTQKVEAQEHPEWHETLIFKDFKLGAGKHAIITVYGTKIIKEKRIGSAKLLIPIVFNKLHSDALELYTSNGKLAGLLMVKTIIHKQDKKRKHINVRDVAF